MYSDVSLRSSLHFLHNLRQNMETIKRPNTDACFIVVVLFYF